MASTYTVPGQEGTVFYNQTPDNITKQVTPQQAQIQQQSATPSYSQPPPITQQDNADRSFFNTPTVTNNAMGFRDYFTGKGYNVGYNDQTKQPTLNGIPIDPNQFNLTNGRYMGTLDQFNSLENQLKPPVDPATANLSKNPTPEDIKFYQDQAVNITNARNSQINQLMGETKTPYDQSISNEILRVLRTAHDTKYSFDPNTDKDYQRADAEIQKKNIDEMSDRGLLHSSITTDRSQKLRQELIPQYEALALKKYNDNLDRELKYADSLSKIDTTFYNRYRDHIEDVLKQVDVVEKMKTADLLLIKNNLDTTFKISENKYDTSLKQIELKEKEYDKAMDRIEVRGVVDNRDSIITGILPGTPSKFANQETIKTKNSLELKKQQLLDDKDLEATKHANVMTKLERETDIKHEEERVKAAQVTNVGLIMMKTQTMTTDEAIQYINANAESIKQVVGEYFKDIVSEIQKRKVEDDKNNIDINYKNATLAISKRNSDTSARNSDTSARNSDISAFNAETSRMNAEKTKSTSTVDTNKSYGEDYAKLKSMSVDEAKKTLEDNSSALIAAYGDKGYKDLWNSSLSDAINMNNQAIESAKTTKLAATLPYPNIYEKK